jgi:hypothetical protein
MAQMQMHLLFLYMCVCVCACVRVCVSVCIFNMAIFTSSISKNGSRRVVTGYKTTHATEFCSRIFKF